MTDAPAPTDAPLLDGVRVLDLSRLLPGPFCTQLLCDMGAEIIKIEDRSGGDYARHYPPFSPHGDGAFFDAVNRGKKSVALDLKNPEGVALLEQLVADADVLVESFRPGVLAKLGLPPERLDALNPRLVRCALTGYGQHGPYSERAGHDLNYIALSGLLEQTGTPATPTLPGFQVADIAGGALYAALGICAALLRRERHGKGASLDISMTHGALSLHAPAHGALRALLAAQIPPPSRAADMLTGALPCYRIYQTSDGGFMALGALEPKFYHGFLRAVGLEQDEELMMGGLSTGEEGARCHARLEAIFADRTRDEWEALMADHDVCCEPVLSPLEALSHALHTTRDTFFQAQGVTYTSSPLGVAENARCRAPHHGEHTDEVLARYRRKEELEALRAAKVIL